MYICLSKLINMKRIYFSLICFCNVLLSSSQILVDNNTPNNSPTFLIDNILLGTGVIATNHSFQGDSLQIGYFNALNCVNFGLDSGIIISTGDVNEVDPVSIPTFPFFSNTVTDPDLLGVANSVPPLLPSPFTNSFSVSSVNDIAILEFDFIPLGDSLNFRYIFGSEEYFMYENTEYNDVFGFFLSGPGISGPYSSPINHPNGSINLAIIPNSIPPLPVTISSVNSITPINDQYFIDNSSLTDIASADGYTRIFTAKEAVIPCESYHIRLAIADGSDGALSSYVWLEAASFSSVEPGSINAQISTTDVSCHGDSNGTASICVQGPSPPYTINWNSQDPNSLSAGNYTVNITDANGIISIQPYVINEPTDILTTISQPSSDLESNTIGGTPNYTYQWLFMGSVVGTNINYTPTQNGDYMLIITDANGCTDSSEVYSVTNVPASLTEHLTDKLIIYPNPFTDKTTINLLNKHTVLIEVSLYDPTGRKVKNYSVSDQRKSIIIEKENLANGMYMLVVRTNNYICKSKLFIR